MPEYICKYVFPCELLLETSSQKAHEQAQGEINSECISGFQETKEECINVAVALVGHCADI
jgi:hypothetical protein